MARTQKDIIKSTEEWLDERYSIWEMANRNEDLQYYRGAVKAIEFMGCEWRRDKNGKHTILKA